jgi:cytochrome P450
MKPQDQLKSGISDGLASPHGETSVPPSLNKDIDPHAQRSPSRSTSQPAEPPGPASLNPLGSYKQFRTSPLDFLEQQVDLFGDSVRFKVGPRLYYFFRRPEHVREVLMAGPRRFPRADAAYQIAKTLGAGLVTTDGEEWRTQRVATQPPLAGQNFLRFAPMVAEYAERSVENFRRAIPLTGGILNVTSAGFEFALSVAATAFLGINPETDMSAFRRALYTMGHFTMDRIATAFRLPLWIPLPRHVSFGRAKQVVDRIVYRTISDLRKTGPKGDSLLSHLMYPDGIATPCVQADLQLRDQIVTLFLAGFDTTASAFSFCCFLLATHPEIALEVTNELDHDDRRTDRDSGRVNRLRAVIYETLRLYPPVPMFSRRATGDDIIGGFRVRKGAEVWVCPYLTHRHPANWPNPDKFQPWRWLDSTKNPMVRGDYLPFGKGPHTCIGAGFAMMELDIALRVLLRRFRLTAETITVKPVARIALGTEEDIFVRLTVR